MTGLLFRYNRNYGVITETEQAILKKKSVCIIGCGGLGGSIIEGLTRMGVGMLTIVDADVFDETNLNRQVLSHEGNLGKSKAEEGAVQMAQINSEVEIRPLHKKIDENNAVDIIGGHDVVVDALDNVQTRLVVEDACESAAIPLVHGAIGGWLGQVSVVRPGDSLLHRVYGETAEDGEEPEISRAEKENVPAGNPFFTSAVVAAIQVAETIKVLLGRKSTLENKMLMIDMMEHEYETINFDR